jgi:glucosamine--fructose-6-phosphate aminotransferase (isomerizing)
MGKGPDIARLRRIAVETETRGRHAFGLAWLDAAGCIQQFKRPGAASTCLEDLERCRDARIVIGHCRYATHGDPADNRNNHPHPAGGGCIVHNGVVRNFARLIDAHALAPVTDCDSEVLGLMIAKGTGPLTARTARTVAQADGNLAL